MRRYQGENLPEGCSIAVIANDAIGNFVVATPLLQMLRSRHRPARIDYYGGTRTLELQEASDLFDWNYPWHGAPTRSAIETALSRGRYDLVVNVEASPFAKQTPAILAQEDTYVCGPAMADGGRGELPYPEDETGRLWEDKEWISEDIARKHPILKSGFIAEIYCRLCYLEGAIPPYRVPSAAPPVAVPDILMATAASLPDKLWPIENWIAVVMAARDRGLSVGLLGAKPKDQAAFWKGSTAEDELVRTNLVEDLRGKLTLPQVVGALGMAKAVVTLDNGILHLAVAAGARTVGLFRFGIHRLWAPPVESLYRLTPGEGRAVAEIPVESVLEALERAL